VTRSLWQRWFSSSPDRALSRRRKGDPTPIYFRPSLLTLEDRTLLSGPAASFLVSCFPASIAVDGGSTFTVTAKDASNNTLTTYSGTVHFTSSDSQAVLPANATLTNGTGTFQAVLKTAGTQSRTATDTITSSITGSESGIVVNAAAGMHEVCG